MHLSHDINFNQETLATFQASTSIMYSYRLNIDSTLNELCLQALHYGLLAELSVLKPRPHSIRVIAQLFLGGGGGVCGTNSTASRCCCVELYIVQRFIPSQEFQEFLATTITSVYLQTQPILCQWWPISGRSSPKRGLFQAAAGNTQPDTQSSSS